MNLTEQTIRLLQPFEASEVKWKPQSVKNNKAMMIAYVDVRVVMDRLDDAIGLNCWQDTYEVLENNSVKCKLRVRFENGEWIEKEDVGSPSEQPDEGDRMKAAFSDALKRTAVKFGVGRYLYRLGSQWVDYDPQTRRPLKVPQLPAWAMPAGTKNNPQPAQNGTGLDEGRKTILLDMFREAKLDFHAADVQQRLAETLGRVVDHPSKLTEREYEQLVESMRKRKAKKQQNQSANTNAA